MFKWSINTSLILVALFVFTACEDENGAPTIVDDFDRQVMLEGWADHIIIPAITAFSQETEALKVAGEAFEANPSTETFSALREAWWTAYLSWQKVSMFEIGKAEEIMLRDNLNIYPTDTEGIVENINAGSYNLELPSQRDKQGFPALDFLLYGLAEGDDALLEVYTTRDEAAAYRAYVASVCIRIDELSDMALASWTSGYKDEFVANSGNSATASVDRMVNDYIFYYEKALRAGKIGIPAGVFSGNPLATHVESLYKGDGAKALFLEALNATIAFFNGQHYNGTETTQSLADYLDYLDATKDGQAISTLINKQFDSAIEASAKLGDNFADQVQNDNILMLQAYDELQKNVVLLKVDMLQALNINVDYVDADGD
jgi:hypothetical protein